MEDIFSLSGNVAIVTGGNGGIGKGIADGLASKGCDIVVAARDDDKTAEAVRDLKSRFGVRVLGVPVDVGHEESIQNMVKQVLDEFRQINILVNNAGINDPRKMPQDYAVEEWDKIMDVNLRGAFLCAKAVYPAMKKVGGGKIINIGSMTSLFGGAKVPVYACSKAGIVQLTYSLAIAWATDNIQVNALLPGWIETPLTVSTRKLFPGIDDHVLNRTPAGRWGKPKDFAGVAVFLASRASDFITAEYIKVDGGHAQGLLIM
jgi:2-deoxy-D-gluconate 3-dehydrogenase